jgi:hypothetical protein
MGLTEVGAGVTATRDGITLLLAGRTIHANPPAVADALEAAIAAGGDVNAAFAKIALAHPDAPIATDLAMGPLALPVPLTLGVGITASVFVPAVLEYARRARVERIFDPTPMFEEAARAAKVYYMTHGEFPAGDAGWTPSRCCDQPGGMCAAVPDQFTASRIWTELGIRVEVPQPFSYWYKGSPTRFTLKAEADLDCDKKSYTKVWLQGRVENGGPVVEISRSDE